MSVDAPTSVSAEMGSAPATMVSPHREAGMPTPLVGMLLFIASEVMFFGGLFAAYFNSPRRLRRDGARSSGGAARIMPDRRCPITIILLTSSVTMQFGVWAIRRGDQRAMRFWTIVTLVLGVVFLFGQLYDYSLLGFGISDGIFGTVFYTLTGFHGAHVFGGVVGLTILSARAGRPVQRPNHVAVEAVSIYWHFVDVVWVALFTTIYFLR